MSRGKGDAPSTAKAAYRSGTRITDERTGAIHDYRARSGVEWTGMAAPDGAPGWTRDRAALWNAAEKKENRKNSVTARELMAPLPAEVTAEERQRITQEMMAFLVDRYGVAVDAAIHRPSKEGDERNHHAHLLFTTRSIGPDGWGDKTRILDESVKKDAKGKIIGGAEIEAIRAELATITNRALERCGSADRVDHRSYERRGIDREGGPHLGPAATEAERRGERSKKGDEQRETQARNEEREALRQELDVIEFRLDREDFREAGDLEDEAQPEPARPRSADEIMRENDALSLDTLTAQHSTFTRRDMARLVSRHTENADEFTSVLAKLEADPHLVRLGKDDQDQVRFTTRAMQDIEQRMDSHVETMFGRHWHRVTAAAQAGNVKLGDDQKAALDHILQGPDLCTVIGFAGSGKSTMLETARRSWEQAGYRVQGMALAGIAADGLQTGAGIDSRTIHSRLHQWDKGKETLTSNDVLVMDEAGMVGSRLMERVLAHACHAGAKVVLVGDVEQLQAIEAGGAMRAIIKRTGYAEISTIRRQKEDWQQEATRELATARTGAALDRYEQAGMVRGHATTDDAKRAVIDGWKQARQDHPQDSQIILAYRRADVRDLNEMARTHRREAGELGDDHEFQTERGKAAFAAGDRIYFLKNDRDMAVRNGSLATIEGITGDRITARLDEKHRRLTFSATDYPDFMHGYAATIHKSQGVTVDRAHVLVSSNLDRHAAYVGMSRHRARLDVHWAKDDIEDRAALTRTLSRERLKDTSLDYGDDERGPRRGQSSRAGPQRPDAPAKDKAEAAPPRAETPSSRRVDREKARFEQWASARRAEWQNHTHDAVIEQERGQQAEIHALERAQDRASPQRQEQEAALAAIALRQQQGGLSGLTYRLSGNAARDREQADAITKTMADQTKRHAEQVRTLTNRHEAERSKLAAQLTRQHEQLERRIERARDRREREGWQDQRAQAARQGESTSQAERTTEAQKGPVDAPNISRQFNSPESSEATHGRNLEQDGKVSSPIAKPDDGAALRKAQQAAKEAAQIEAANAADRAARNDERDMGRSI